MHQLGLVDDLLVAIICSHANVFHLIYSDLQDAANSSDIAHVFEMLSMDQFDEDMLGPVQLRAKVGSNYCYLAFDTSNLPLHKTCTPEPTAKVSKTGTFFSLVPM